MMKPKEDKSRKCILNCKSRKKLFSFPDEVNIAKLWLNKLGLPETLLNESAEMYICLDHFSALQLAKNSKTITPTSIPDKNIPSKQNLLSSKVNNHPPPAKIANNGTATEGNLKKSTMITSFSSKCVLKCKTYKTLHRFPKDMTSFKVWVKKLGLPESHRQTRTVSVCDNHFSPAMRTSRKITTCAVPDINLPSQCTFIDEIELASKESITSSSNSERTTPKACLQPRVSDEATIVDNLKNQVKSIPESIIPSFNNEDCVQPIVIDESTTVNNLKNPGTSIAFNNKNTAPTVLPTLDVICPENYTNSAFECVLKCPDSTVLYRFPKVESRRQLWLSKIGLTHCLCTTRICNRHFSERMISNKRLMNSAYPDINLPDINKLRVASLPLENKLPQPIVQDVPQFICVLTVVTQNKQLESMVNSTRYVKYTVDKMMPKRERSIQVDLDDLIGRTNKAIMVEEEMTDDDGEDDDDKFEAFENINCEQQSDVTSNEDSSQVFPSRSRDMFECLKCGEITVDQESNDKHLDLHRELSHLCFQCGRKFTSADKLNAHEMKIHNEPWKIMVKRCPKEHCKKAFHSRRNLNQHLDEHVKRARHYCCNCGRLFFSVLKLNCHLLLCKPKNLRCRLKG